jgi:molybdopterin converting factor subunit 1
MEVLLFGISKDLCGERSCRIHQEMTVAEVKKFLADRYPRFVEMPDYAVAVNERYATDDLTVGVDDTLAIIPPVSGG